MNLIINSSKKLLLSPAGNALFLILIGVALFAALSYAVTQSSRGGGSIDAEEQMLARAVSEQCNASVNYAIDKLSMLNHCYENEISFELPDGDNPNSNAPPDKSCHVFHPNGGGVAPCGAYLGVEFCDLESLALGEKCPNGDVVYAGSRDGRFYTTTADSGSVAWATDVPSSAGGATSYSDGMANTNAILANTGSGAPFPAAELCRSLGPEWYLPARNEAGTLTANSAEIGGFDPVLYWTSTHNTDYTAWHQSADPDYDGSSGNTSHKRDNAHRVRCIRR